MSGTLFSQSKKELQQEILRLQNENKTVTQQNNKLLNENSQLINDNSKLSTEIQELKNINLAYHTSCSEFRKFHEDCNKSTTIEGKSKTMPPIELIEEEEPKIIPQNTFTSKTLQKIAVHPDFSHIKVAKDVKVGVKIITNSKGDIVSVMHYSSKSTTTDETIIKQVLEAVKKIKYTPYSESGNSVHFETFEIKKTTKL